MLVWFSGGQNKQTGGKKKKIKNKTKGQKKKIQN